MIAFLMPFVLFVTVAASVGFGILTAYIVVIGILHSFGSASQPAPRRPRLVLVPTQTQASGD